MKKTDLGKLYLRLMSLAVFRELLKDEVLHALLDYLSAYKTEDEALCVSTYSTFVSELYKTDKADLSAHIKDITLNQENAYVRAVGKGDEVQGALKEATFEELKTLQEVCDLSPEVLLEGLSVKAFLPRFSSEKVDITESFSHRVQNVSKYGYGIYAKNPMFYIGSSGKIVAAKSPDLISLTDLVDYEQERKVIIENTLALLEGRPALNILLSGDAGTGKSSTVKAIGNEFFDDGLRIIEIRKDQLREIPMILDELSDNPLKFILFIDDLSFLQNDDSFHALKAVLEGSVSMRGKNVVIYATSNRRHMVKENFSDREGDEIHRNDSLQETISLSERFGIHVRFYKPSKAVYLKIVHHLAKENAIRMDEEALDLLAERFALERGGRSARLARQFVDTLRSTAKDEA